MNWHIDTTPDFKVGDPCPEGYIARQEWAEVHYKAGLRQKMCCKCCLWFFPHELSDKIISSTGFTGKGKPVVIESAVCKVCDR